MAKRVLINSRKYTYFIDYDRKQLSGHPEDWMEWLDYRMHFILFDPIEEMLKPETWKRLDNENWTMAIGIALLICCGIDSVAQLFEGKKSNQAFGNFVAAYMDERYRKDKVNIEILRDSFRHGLVHGFHIKRGGLGWGARYFSEHPDFGIQISLPMLYADFRRAFRRYLLMLKRDADLRAKFETRFKETFCKL